MDIIDNMFISHICLKIKQKSLSLIEIKEEELAMSSIFDILGPIMVGPSSSHTAGAVRIGYTARQLFGEPVKKAEVYLHGSFAATGEGHGTDKAIIAGLLGMKPDDLRIPDSFTVAEESGMEFTIAKKEIRGAHPNTARVIMENGADKKMVMQAYSIGGGRIRVSVLDGIEVEMQIKMRKKRFGRGYFAI